MKSMLYDILRVFLKNMQHKESLKQILLTTLLSIDILFLLFMIVYSRIR